MPRFHFACCVLLASAVQACSAPAVVAQRRASSHSMRRIGASASIAWPARWTTFQFSSTHNAVLAHPAIAARWNIQLPDKTNGGMALWKGLLVTDNFDGSVYAVDARTGALRWKTLVDNVVMSTPVVADGITVVGSGRDGWLNPQAGDPERQIWGRPQGDAVYGISARDGRPLWTFRTVGDDMASPAIANRTVVFANGDLHAYGLDLRTGALKWRTPLNGVASMDSATVDGDDAFIGVCRAAPHKCETDALDLSTGRILWRNAIGSADASAAVAYGEVFTTMLNLSAPGAFNQGGTSTVAAIDEATGKTRWSWTSAAGPCTFVGSGEHEIAGTISDGLFIDSIGCGSEVDAFDARTGRLVWRRPTWAHVKMSAVAYRGKVYFGDTNGVLYALDERTGRIIRTVSFDQMFTTAPFVIVGSTLFAACSSEIYAFPLAAGISPLEVARHDIYNDRPTVNDARALRSSYPAR